MLDGLDLILRWYLDEIRPRMGDGPTLFCDEGGGRIHRGTVRNRLSSLLEMEQSAAQARGQHGEPARFSPHTLRHACATRNYERGVDLVAIQQMLALACRDHDALRQMSRIASDATFGGKHEWPLPAVQLWRPAGKLQPRRRRIADDLRFHHPAVPGARRLHPVSLHQMKACRIRCNHEEHQRGGTNLSRSSSWGYSAGLEHCSLPVFSRELHQTGEGTADLR